MKFKEFVDECLKQCKDCERYSVQSISSWKPLGTHDSNKVCYCVRDERYGFQFMKWHWVKIGYPFVKYSEGMEEIGLTADSTTKKFFKNPENWRTCPYYAERYVRLMNLDD